MYQPPGNVQPPEILTPWRPKLTATHETSSLRFCICHLAGRNICYSAFAYHRTYSFHRLLGDHHFQESYYRTRRPIAGQLVFQVKLIVLSSRRINKGKGACECILILAKLAFKVGQASNAEMRSQKRHTAIPISSCYKCASLRRR